MNPSLSGVAKFNKILANRLEIPCLSYKSFNSETNGPIVLSIKLEDASKEDLSYLKYIIDTVMNNNISLDLFLHKLADSPLENQLLDQSRYIYCGNQEIFSELSNHKQIEGINKKLILAWCPALVDHTQEETLTPHQELQFFTFGMAHKLKIEYFKQLMSHLNFLDNDYSLWVSSAFHEKANFGDFNSISNELNSLFHKKLHFLGFLSDSGINYFLKKTDSVIAFFDKGARSNNTSLFASMERGCCVITNLDKNSPSWLKHGENIIDIHKISNMELNHQLFKKVGAKAAQDVCKFASWTGLIDLFHSDEAPSDKSLRPSTEVTL